MTAPNDTAQGWPDPARPGVPVDPERSGWHWILGHASGRKVPVEWRSGSRFWFYEGELTSFEMAINSYLGPCTPPASPSAGADVVEAARALLPTLQHIIECPATFNALDTDVLRPRVTALDAALSAARQPQPVRDEDSPRKITNADLSRMWKNNAFMQASMPDPGKQSAAAVTPPNPAMVSVPREPTREMLNRALHVLPVPGSLRDETHRKIWAAMLSAAPITGETDGDS